MRERKNVKCPKCNKPVPFEILEAREGKCNYCEYQIWASPLSKFLCVLNFFKFLHDKSILWTLKVSGQEVFVANLNSKI